MLCGWLPRIVYWYGNEIDYMLHILLMSVSGLSRYTHHFVWSIATLRNWECVHLHCKVSGVDLYPYHLSTSDMKAIIERPLLSKGLDAPTFRKYYYLKAELVDFCRTEQLQTSGGKLELTERVAHYLATGERISTKRVAKNKAIEAPTMNTTIGPNFGYSETNRTFFEKHIGKKFTFNVLFQKWLKENPDKTFGDAITAYHCIKKDRKHTRTIIGKQFEYNTYIRDYFDDNPNGSLREAIACWKYKKGIASHNRYEKSDLEAIKTE